MPLKARYAASVSVEPSMQGRPTGLGKLNPCRQAIVDRVRAKPDVAMPDLSMWLEVQHGVTASTSSLSNFLCRERIIYKTRLASEKERPLQVPTPNPYAPLILRSAPSSQNFSRTAFRWILPTGVRGNGSICRMTRPGFL